MNDSYDNRKDDDAMLQNIISHPYVIAHVDSSDKNKPPYPITRNEAGEPLCPCIGFQRRMNCRHVKMVKEGHPDVRWTREGLTNLDGTNHPFLPEKPPALAVSEEATIRLTLKLGGNTTIGVPVCYSSLRVGDVSELEALEGRLSRLLGMPVRFDTAEELWPDASR